MELICLNLNILKYLKNSVFSVFELEIVQLDNSGT